MWSYTGHVAWGKARALSRPLLRRLGVSSLSLRGVGLEPPYEPCTHGCCGYQERSRRIAPPSSIHSQHMPLCRKTRATDKHLPCVIKHNKLSNNLVKSYYVIKCTDQNYFCQVLLSNFLVRGLFSVSLRMYNKKHQRLPRIISTC